MCYSAMVKEDIRKLERMYNAHLSWDDFLELYKQRDRDFSLKIPGGMDAQLIAVGGTAAKEIQSLCNRYRVAERARQEEAIAGVLNELIVLEDAVAKKPTKTAQTKLDTKIRKLKKLQAAAAAPSVVAVNYRVYPYQFAPVIMQAGEQRSIVPMRYRVLPRTGVEVPPQYNVFNARRDSLQTVRTWKPLFGAKHALFPFERFYEWVDRDGKKVELTFTPDGYESMWAAALYEEFKSTELGTIRSFAMVTDEPPPEVAAAGHDRCPVFIDRTLVDDWLAPTGQSLEQLDALLGHKQPTYYSHALAA